MMKMLFWGHNGNVHHPLEEMHHLSPARRQAQAKAFADAGYDVTMATFHREGVVDLAPNLRRRHIFDLNIEEFDIVFLNFRLAINQLYNYAYGLESRHSRIFQNRETYFRKILDHPNIAIQLDAPRSFVTDGNTQEEVRLLKHLKHIGISTHQGIKNWEKTRKTNNHFLCHAATISYRPDIGEDPMPVSGRKRVLYLGRLNDAAEISSLDKLEELAKRLPDTDFVVVSCKIRNKFNGRMITPMLTDPDHVTQNKIVEAKKQFIAPNIVFMPGPRYSDTFQYMYHADLGIGFAVRGGQDACSCKVYEYLGTGCPIVIEDHVPEAWLLDEVECGLKSKTHDFDDMAAKIEEALKIPYDRSNIKNHVLKNHSYETRVQQYINRFEEVK